MSTDVPRVSPRALPAGPPARPPDAFPQVSRWGGWGSNPRPADYESAALTG
jgi:hypothetical protein